MEFAQIIKEQNKVIGSKPILDGMKKLRKAKMTEAEREAKMRRLFEENYDGWGLKFAGVREGCLDVLADFHGAPIRVTFGLCKSDKDGRKTVIKVTDTQFDYLRSR